VYLHRPRVIPPTMCTLDVLKPTLIVWFRKKVVCLVTCLSLEGVKVVSFRLLWIVEDGYIDQRKCVVNAHNLFVDSAGDF
jgi:hypothetical protein